MASEITPGQKVLVVAEVVDVGAQDGTLMVDVFLDEPSEDVAMMAPVEGIEPQFAIPLDDLREVLRDLTEDGECSFDHHGYCQEHGWLIDERPCPHPRARDLLSRLGEAG